MPQLIVAALILWAVVAGPRWLARTSRGDIAKLTKGAAGSAALVVAVLVLLRGSVEGAAALAAFGFGLLGSRALGPGSILGFASSQFSSPRARLFRSQTIELKIDRFTNAAQGRVLSGSYAGAALSELSESQCLEILAACRSEDAYGVQLLEAYLDRSLPRWRATGEGDRDASGFGRSRSRSMTEEYAYEMLGLAKGATREDITRAHRTLMKKVHPDHGGTTSLAALLNEAKDVLMRRHG